MMRLGDLVRQRMGHAGGLFDLVAKIAGFSSGRSIKWYTVANSDDPDGVMHENCNRARSVCEQNHPDADMFHYSRHCIISFDAMHAKGCFAVTRNTNELVAIDNSVFGEDVILNKLRQLDKNVESESEEINLPEVAKHFLACIATT